MRSRAATVAVFALGVTVGVVMTSLAARRASQQFLRIIGANCEGEQLRLAMSAEAAGQMEAAVHHHRNLVTWSTKAGFQCVRSDHDPWTLDFPFSSLVFERVASHLGTHVPATEYVNRIVLARTLEQAGRPDEALAEYERGSRLLERKVDLAALRDAADKVIAARREAAKAGGPGHGG